MAADARFVRKQFLRVEHKRANSHQHYSQADAEAHKKAQAQGGMADCNCTQQKDERRRTGYHAATGAESNQAPYRDSFLRHDVRMGGPVVRVNEATLLGRSGKKLQGLVGLTAGPS